MTKTPRNESEMLAKLEQWLADLERKPTLADFVHSGDVDLFAAFTLKVFRTAAREAVLDRLGREAAALHRPLEDLGNAVMRVFSGLAEAWGLSPAEQLALLGLQGERELGAVKGISEADVPIGVIERVAILLNIFEAINTLLPEPSSADGWI